jgi:hypothetical protein
MHLLYFYDWMGICRVTFAVAWTIEILPLPTQKQSLAPAGADDEIAIAVCGGGACSHTSVYPGDQ